MRHILSAMLDISFKPFRSYFLDSYYPHTNIRTFPPFQYAELHKPLYERRKEIVTGASKPTADEIKAGEEVSLMYVQTLCLHPTR